LLIFCLLSRTGKHKCMYAVNHSYDSQYNHYN
jgi:hypothetical protein